MGRIPRPFGGVMRPRGRTLRTASRSPLLERPRITFYAPESIAPSVLNAVCNNRPFAFDHAEQQHFFHETYRDVVDACFDDIAAYERDHRTPPPAADQPLLGAR